MHILKMVVKLLCFKKMYCFRENSNFPFPNQKIITLVATLYQWNHHRNHTLWNIRSTERKTFHYCCSHLKFDFFPDFSRQNRGGSKLTRGNSQVNLTLIETETRVQAYLDTPFLNFKIFLKVHIKFLHKKNVLFSRKLKFSVF
jgi:hypothetical protein